MELHDYIKGVLLEITGAVEETQKELSDKDVLKAAVAPKNYNKQTKSCMSDAGSRNVTEVEFDVAINVSNSDLKGGYSFNVAEIFEISTNKDQGIRSGLTQRIKFVVPILLPADKAFYKQ